MQIVGDQKRKLGVHNYVCVNTRPFSFGLFLMLMYFARFQKLQLLVRFRSPYYNTMVIKYWH